MHDPKAMTKEHANEELAPVWQAIYEEYVEEFGFNDKYVQYLKTLKNIAVMKCDLIITDNRINETLIEIEEEKLRLFTDQEEPMKYLQTVNVIEKHYGFSINPRIITVAQYTSYIRSMNKKVA